MLVIDGDKGTYSGIDQFLVAVFPQIMYNKCGLWREKGDGQVKKIRRAALWVFGLIFGLAAPGQAFASPVVRAQAHILIDADSGRVLSESNARRRMFPAATTMILTAILAYENIGLDEIIITGNEVTMLPPASGRNHHEIGEAISGENLLRGMLTGAGNDTANIVAIEVARRLTGNEDIAFSAAQTFFANLMTRRAAELGALDSNFMNPHGFHHDNHFTTAHDMAQIARFALTIPAIAQVAALPTFAGPMAGDGDLPEGALAFRRSWRSANELLHVGGDFFYPYAAGFRTGRTNQAGDSLVAVAKRDGLTLISVTFNSPEIGGEPTRWQDNINLFEYGFENFASRVFFQPGELVGRIEIYDPPLDDEGVMEFFAMDYGKYFLSYAEFDRLERVIEFLPEFVNTIYDEALGEEHILLMPPVEEGQIIGTLFYKLDGEVIFKTALYAARDAAERTTARDIDYFMSRVRNTFFSARAVPFWIAGASVLMLLTVLIILARNAIKRKRRHFKYKWK